MQQMNAQHSVQQVPQMIQINPQQYPTQHSPDINFRDLRSQTGQPGMVGTIGHTNMMAQMPHQMESKQEFVQMNLQRQFQDRPDELYAHATFQGNPMHTESLAEYISNDIKQNAVQIGG